MTLSGAFRPGLIEAMANPTWPAGLPPLSGAFRPGLIEAPTQPEDVPPMLNIIRGISPRPR